MWVKMGVLQDPRVIFGKSENFFSLTAVRQALLTTNPRAAKRGHQRLLSLRHPLPLLIVIRLVGLTFYSRDRN